MAQTLSSVVTEYGDIVAITPDACSVVVQSRQDATKLFLFSLGGVVDEQGNTWDGYRLEETFTVPANVFFADGAKAVMAVQQMAVDMLRPWADTEDGQDAEAEAARELFDLSDAWIDVDEMFEFLSEMKLTPTQALARYKKAM